VSKPDEQEIFHAARRIDAPEARRAYLASVCGDEQGLRARVEALLRIHDESQSFLCPPAEGSQPLATRLAGEGLGAFIGSYKLLEQIGEGAFGVVYIAEQRHPVCRKVALKVLKPGMDTRQVVARFEAERQALALMDHANIARVFDGGETASGRPYFVMELVRGVPVTDFCDASHLTVRQRLELFVSLCQAVQHAHQKGVIHRDLKPSNVLVTLHQGAPVVKVIDFGVAKAIGQKLTDKTLFTGFAQMVGTPLYMSPEQAEMSGLDIDTRADIYAMGVLLYELLTGSTPFDKERLHTVAFDELRRIIRQEEPPRPSTRISTLADGAATVSANRGSDPKRLSRLVRGELDWIVMKCLEKDRNRRYETADGLARDVNRYLADEPVEASPPSTAYRLKKFLRRHKGPVLAASIIVLLLVGGIAGTAAGLKLASDRLAQVQAEKDRADEETAIAKAVDDFLQKDLLGQADVGNQPGGARDRNVTVRELLDRAAERLETRFRGQERTEAAIRLTLGRAYRELGEYPQARKHLERSLALREERLGPTHLDTLESMYQVASVYDHLRDYDKAERLFQQVLEARRPQLGADHPDTLQVVNEIGLLYEERGWYDKAEPLLLSTLEARRATLGDEHIDTLESVQSLARLYWSRSQFQRAETLFKQARDGRRAQLGPDHPLTLESMQNLASLYLGWQRYDEAEPLFGQVLEIRRARFGPDHHRTLGTMGELALLYQLRGQFEKAEPLHKQVLAGYRAKLDPDHPDLLRGVQNLAMCYLLAAQYDKAEPLYQEVLKAQRAKQGAEHPDTIGTMTNLAILYRDRGQYGKAEPLFREALVGARKTFGLGHEDTQTIIYHLTVLHDKQGTPELSEPLLRELVSFLRDQPGPESYLLGNQLGYLSENLLRQKKAAEAETVARECLAIRAKYRPDAWTSFYTRALLGRTLLGQKKYAEAEPHLVQGYAGMKEREAKISKDSKFCLTEAVEGLVHLYDAWGKTGEAAKWRKELEARKSSPHK
jgi:serine/threonine protein kinase/tetratricopeptide (TPR) repeat protein